MDLVQEGFYFRPAGWLGKRFSPKLETIDEGGMAGAQGKVSREAKTGGAKNVMGVTRKRIESYERLCSNSVDSLLLPKASTPKLPVVSAPATGAGAQDATGELRGPLDSHTVTAAIIASMRNFEGSPKQSNIKRTNVHVPSKTTNLPRSSHRQSLSSSVPSPTGYNKEIGLYSLSYLASRSAPVLNVIEPVDVIEEEDLEGHVQDSEASAQANSTTTSNVSLPTTSSPTIKPKPSLEQIHYLQGAGTSAQNRRRKNSSFSTLALVDGGSSATTTTTTESDNSSSSLTSSNSNSRSSTFDSESSSGSFLLDADDKDEKIAEGVRMSCEYDSENSPPRIELARTVVPVEGILGGMKGVGRVVVKVL